MKTIRQKIYTAVICAALSPLAMAGGSAEASAQAVTHSLQAVGYSIEGVFRLASGVVALPLMSVGAVGEASGHIGEALWEVADEQPTAALPVTDDVLTTAPQQSPPDAVQP